MSNESESGAPPQTPTPSPYVRLYVSRKQADAMLIALECAIASGDAIGRVREVRAALGHLRKALDPKPAAGDSKKDP